MLKRHRNSQKRIVFEDACYFVTFYTKHRFSYFKEAIFCDLFVENLRLCKRLKGFLLYGWVIIYEHIHLMIQPDDEYDISKVTQFIKRNVSRDINFIMGINYYDKQMTLYSDHDTLTTSLRDILIPPESDNYNCRFQDIRENGETQITYKSLDFYRYIKIKWLLKFRFKVKFINKNPYAKFQWQKSFIDHYIRNDWDFNDKLDYIAYNPEKHKLPYDWPYVYTNPKYDDLTAD